MKSINDIKKLTNIGDIVKTISGNSSLTLSDKETAIMREILSIIVSVGFSDALYDEVLESMLRVYNDIYKDIFKNKHDIDKVIVGLREKGLVTEKTVEFISGKDNEIKVSSWNKVLSLNKKISKSEMDDIITSLVVGGFPEK